MLWRWHGRLWERECAFSEGGIFLDLEVGWYETERISQAKAAEIAGLSRAEFLVALGQFEVTPFQVSADELIQEIQGG